MTRVWRAVSGAALSVGFLLSAEPRPAATDYPVHTALEGVSIGADFLVRSFYGGGRTYAVDEYLVVEVALYPAKGKPFLVNTGSFTLRLNGKKDVRLPQTPGMVAASIKYQDTPRIFEPRVGVGVGDADVTVGRRQPVERFPGDPRARQSRLPAPPRAPAPEDRSGVDREPPPTAEEIVVQAALPERETSQPVCGNLYFSHRGSPAKLKSIELIYAGPGGPATLRLR